MQTEVRNKGFLTKIINFEQIDEQNWQLYIRNTDFVEILGNATLLTGDHIFCVKQDSLITDLTVDTDVLWKSFRSNYRNEIKNVQNTGIIIKRYDAIDLKNDEVLYRFISTYEKMFKSKGLDRKMPWNILKAYINNKYFVLTVARTSGGEDVVYHSYITDWNANSKLWQSCSLFRETDDNEYRKFVGKVNKYLHWEDMIYFKEKNIRTLDWGGIALEKDKGIGKFKQGFGGVPVSYYNISIPCSVKAKLYKKFRT